MPPTFLNHLPSRRYRPAVVWGLALLALAAGATAAQAQRNLKVIPDPDPKLELDSFQVADGLEVNLYAADPLLAKPIHMNFDAQGRLWIAASEVYPHVKPGQEANDKILVLEDADGDGRAEKTTVFADGLLIPTGVVPGNGGAYVANSTELLFLADTDGDGRADRRRVMLSGFGTEDTHHIIHTFRWGPDGMMYFNQSIYIHSHVETPWGVRRLNSGGVWQFRPETMQLEVFTRGLCNPWGHAFDYWGQSFETDGAGGEGINYVFPGATMFTYSGAKRVLRGLNPGSPKHCGLEVISGRHFPADWQGNLITNDFRAHRVCRFVVSEAGAGYASRQADELIKTSHAAFRPVDAKMGPDGALYIADWYNPIIQHGEVDFRDERRDHTHGRIWRVTVKNRPLVERPKIVGAPVGALLEMLRAPEEFTRLHARLELKGRGADQVVPALEAWLAKLDPEDSQYDHLRLEALWTFQALDVPQGKLLAAVAASQDHRARAAATRVLSAWLARIPAAKELLPKLVEDSHPQVRLEAIRALALVPTAEAAALAMRAIDYPMDRFLDHALWLAVRELQPYWLPELEAGRFDFGGNVAQLTYALTAAGSPGVVAPLVNLLKENKLPPERAESVLLLVAALGDPVALRYAFDRALDEQTSPAKRIALLQALCQSARLRKVQPAGDPAAIVALIDAPDEPLRLAAMEAAGLWKATAASDKLRQLAAESATTDPVRREALVGLAALGPQSVEPLSAFCAPGQPTKTRGMAIGALATLDVKQAAGQLIKYLEDDATADPALVVGALLDRKGGAEALAEAAGKGKLTADAAKLAIRAVRATVRDEAEVTKALAAAGGITTPKRTLSAVELAAFVADVNAQGNAERGEAVFRRGAQNCLKCHAIAGAGGQVGPDLVSIGASAQVDYLIESILNPSAKIKENYHSLTVVADGVITSGVRVRESRTEVVLRDAEDREVTIPVDTIEARKDAGSIMPVGLADELTRGELVDLVRFLSELGKVGPYAVGNAPVARRWQALVPGEQATAALSADTEKVATPGGEGLNWTAVYSQVSGNLPLAEVAAVNRREGQPSRVVRSEIEVVSAGKAEFLLRGPVEALWIDGVAISSTQRAATDLSQGVHTLTLLLDGDATGEVRVELTAASTAQAQFVGGK